MIVTKIQKGTDAEKDLYASFSVYVISTKKLMDAPNKKKVYTEDFADSNGQRVYEPISVVYEPKNDIEIEFAITGEVKDIITKYKAFVAYLEKVTPSSQGSLFGSSSFYYWNDDIGIENKKELRYTELSGEGKMTYKSVVDYNNPNITVSAWTFKMKFCIDRP